MGRLPGSPPRLHVEIVRDGAISFLAAGRYRLDR
jgi:hypothetical protein